MKKTPEFIFPKHLLNQLAENSLGYLLFYINERGEIVPVPGFDSQLTATALISFARSFSEAVEEVELKNIVNLFEQTDEKENLENGDDELL